MRINEDQAISGVKMAEEKLANLAGRKIAVLGLVFEPCIDDMREAVSIRIVKELLKRKAKVFAHDPKATIQLQLPQRQNFIRNESKGMP